jgi:alkylation response protein AidB-like acyl-CoA dehydrogenase
VRFAFDEDHLALRHAVATLLGRRAGVDLLRAVWDDPAAPAAWSLWSELAGMGVQGLMAPADAGGSGLDWVAAALILAEAGRAALPLPLADTAVASAALAAAGDPGGWLAGLAAGDVVAAASGGPGQPAPAAGRADLFVVGDALYPRDQVRLEPVSSVDRTRDCARVSPVGEGHPLPGAADAGALATAAVLIGLGRALVAMTVEYVQQRRQFGVPVGSFQAVKHRLADAHLQVEFAAPAVWSAAWELSHPGAAAAGQVERSVSLAKALASDAATGAARAALQCHGAMGYTVEYHLHFWLKRVWSLAPAFGDAHYHRRRVARSLGLSR